MRKNPEKNFILLSTFEIFDHIINTLLIPRLKAQLIFNSHTNNFFLNYHKTYFFHLAYC